MRFRVHAIMMLLPLSAVVFSCAQLADRNNVRVAKVDGEYITRADFYDYIRSFPEMTRPKINNTADMLAVLNRMVDGRVKSQYVDPVIMSKLNDEQRASVLAETEARARETFFLRLGDQAEQMRAVWEMEIPANDQPTELMNVYGLTADSLRETQAFIREQSAIIQRELLADQAVTIMAGQALQAGEIAVDPKALELEFAFQRENLVLPESVTFTGIRIAVREPGSLEKAQAVRQRLDSGESFDLIAQGFRAQNPDSVTQNTLQRSEASQSFEEFWNTIGTAAPGDTAGPILMPSYQQMAVDASGQQRPMQVAETYMIVRVDAREPERAMTLQEATPRIAPPLIVAEMMKSLREKHGVEIYEDKLPEAGQFGGPTPMKPLA